jgi:hypothetical protein
MSRVADVISAHTPNNDRRAALQAPQDDLRSHRDGHEARLHGVMSKNVLIFTL